jgi:hypothetical protein
VDLDYTEAKDMVEKKPQLGAEVVQHPNQRPASQFTALEGADTIRTDTDGDVGILVEEKIVKDHTLNANIASTEWSESKMLEIFPDLGS